MPTKSKIPSLKSIDASAEAGSPQPVVSGAPPLPPHVAKQYGLHDHAADHALPQTPLSEQTDAIMHDAATDAAVDDIAATDADALLAAEDAARIPADTKKSGFWAAIGRFFRGWWRNRLARYITLLLLFGGIGVIAIIPPARYYVLNAAGVRSSASVVVLDTATRMPLKNVRVSVGGATAKTNVDGKASFSGLELGPTKLRITRVAFAPYDVGITIGWGSNPLGEYKLQATGVQYVMQLTDYASGKPLANVEAASAGANALSDKKGRLVLTVADSEDTTLPVSIGKQGYRTEELVLNAESETATPVAMVSAQKHVFVERQQNKYELYSIDLDGKNKQVVLPATGNESSNISIAMSGDGMRTAVVSTRDGTRDRDGFMLSALTLINMETGAYEIIDHGSQIQIVGWHGERLVYRSTISSASAANAQRYRIMTYNTETNGKLQLTTANQFTATQLVGDHVYYAASSSDPRATMGLFRVRPDGAGKERILEGEVWTTYRADFTTLLVQTVQGWQRYDTSTKSATAVATPSVLGSRAYAMRADGDTAVWIDGARSPATLVLRGIGSGKDTKLVSEAGLTAPVRWAGDMSIVYRVSVGGQVADYVVSPAGGTPHKITDAAVSYGVLAE